MSRPFLFQAQQEYHLKKLREDVIVFLNEEACIFSVASRTPADAYASLHLSGDKALRVPVYADAEHRFLDAEGGVEFFRAASMYGASVIPVAPLDYSVCWRLQSLGAAQIELEVSNPFLERGIIRPELLVFLMQTIDIPIIAGGIFSADDIQRLWDLGFHAILNYKTESM